MSVNQSSHAPRSSHRPGSRCLDDEEHPRPDDFDALEGVGLEEPLHHLTVEQRECELLVVALHPEAAVEIVVLELDVVQTEMTRRSVKNLRGQRRSGGRGRDRQGARR